MEGIIALWIPILLSAALMFIISSIFWVLLPVHRNEWAATPNEPQLSAGLADLPSGQYSVPHGNMNADWHASILMRRGRVNFGKNLFLHFLNQLLIAVFAGYLAYYGLAPEATYVHVFRIVGTALVLGQIGALYSRAIWWGWRWRSALVETVEGIIYALFAAGVFGWWWVR